MTTIPEMCMQYTAIFNTVRIELFVSLAAGIAIGVIAGRLHK